jgi:hypothetical protein
MSNGTSNESNNKFNFLITAIKDSQELIRFLDYKTAFILTIVSGYFIAIFSTIEKVIKYCSYFSCFFWLIYFLIIMLLSICILIILRIFKPTISPKENINIGDNKIPLPSFFITKINYNNSFFSYFFNSKKDILSKSFSEYKKEILNTSENDILDSLSFELLKVSFIRTLKEDRLNALLFVFIISTVFVALYFIVFYVITKDIF